MELKLRCTIHCVLSVGGADNAIDNAILLLLLKTLSSCSNFISKRQQKIIKTS